MKLTEEYFIEKGYERYKSGWQLCFFKKFESDSEELKEQSVTVFLNYNAIYDSWIYEDFRNRLFGIKTVEELETLYKFLKLK